MAETWQRHKKFISVVGGEGLFALILLLALVFPARGAATKARDEALSIEAEVRSLRGSERFRDEDDVRSIEQEIGTLRAIVGQVDKEIEFHGSDDFRLDPAEKDVLAAFASKRDGTMSRLAAAASKAGAAFPDTLAFDPAKEPGAAPDDTLRKMERLDMIDRASRLAIECGVKRIESFSHGESLDREIGPAATGNTFIARNMLRMTIGGPFEAVMRFLHGVQRRGAYMAVYDCTIEKTDPDTDTDDVRATVTIAALHVDLEAKRTAPDEKEDQGPKRPKKPPRGTWR